MCDNIDSFAKFLEEMMDEATGQGKHYIQPTLEVEEVYEIIKGLRLLTEPKLTESAVEIIPNESPLADTVEGMLHPDYKERFKAEYQQTKIRYEKLKEFNTKIKAAHMSSVVEMPKHDCPDELLREQQSIMGQYLHVLEVRAKIEHIDIT